VTNLCVFIFIINVSFQDLIVFGIEVLDTICLEENIYWADN